MPGGTHDLARGRVRVAVTTTAVGAIPVPRIGHSGRHGHFRRHVAGLDSGQAHAERQEDPEKQGEDLAREPAFQHWVSLAKSLLGDKSTACESYSSLNVPGRGTIPVPPQMRHMTDWSGRYLCGSRRKSPLRCAVTMPEPAQDGQFWNFARGSSLAGEGGSAGMSGARDRSQHFG
jgi:hypothetical protein